ncbi:hypothetical protein K505DRAFT_288078 [Melanomma pulvis-pyrius CBS 109.77]|uniref:SH3 domain-containing protein n=1 Tax=Melanomma pulvis-pyrius CBS 109.77 TaxID=1314802 RepID=A0A6A6WUG6_9PLEO|nr:hypothetical protein K505DRAFT_288078 [Melanomma pulvis-pyrius CBS 109.77]
MALAVSAKEKDMSADLAALEPIGPDEYFVAFGTDGRQFCGTPNGYSAVHLPAKVVEYLASRREKVKKIVWVSYGSDWNSWFFRYETHDGRSINRYGNATPLTLRQFIDYTISCTSPHLVASLRVQLGSDGSFLAWTRGLWICHRIPEPLKAILLQESSQHAKGDDGLLKGVFTEQRHLTHASWHDNGSFYVNISGHIWNFQSDITKLAWNDLWRERGQDLITPTELADLAYATINPHSADGDSFVFIKNRKDGKDPDFVLRFASEDTVSRLASKEYVGPAEESLLPIPTSPQPITTLLQAPMEPLSFTWARSKRTGRPHAKEDWELRLHKGEMVKVLQARGRGWYIVLNVRDVKGWVHETWLDFNVHADPREAYVLFKEETSEMLKSGALREFPMLSRYMDICTEDGCKIIKQDSTGLSICAHDLERLLRGSGVYTVDFLKGERNTWHPDKFARFCHPESRDDLQRKAGALFVLFGVLIDLLQNPQAEV